ncbi:MAG: flotillin family protein, partial [Limisphaerales bacterium]
MQFAPLLAQLSAGHDTTIIIVSIVGVFILFMLFYMVLSRYTKVGPNQVLVVSGIQHRAEDGTKVGFRIVKGGG